MTDHIVSPNEAAVIAETSRSAIMRAIYKKTLFAELNNERRWVITRDNLDKWLKDRPKKRMTSGRDSKDNRSTFEVENAVLANKLENSEERRLETVAALDAERAKSAQLLAMVQELAKPRWPWSRRITLPQSAD